MGNGWGRVGRMEDFKLTFREEAEELLTDLEADLLELGGHPDNRDLVDRIFRTVHTIKGSGAMFGFDGMVGFVHELETALDMVRQGRIRISPSLIDVILASCDEIKRMIEGRDPEGRFADELLGLLRRIVPDAAEPGQGDAEAGPVAPVHECAGIDRTYRISFDPLPELFENGTNPSLLLAELARMGHCEILAILDDVPELKAMNPEICYLRWRMRLTTARDPGHIRDVFIFVEDLCRLTITSVDDAVAEEPLSSGPVSAPPFRPEEIRAGPPEGSSSSSVPDTVPTTPRMVPGGEECRESDGASLPNGEGQRRSVRVASGKLDTLVDLVGELVTVQAGLSQRAIRLADPDMILLAEHLEQLIADLRDNTISIRMQPVGGLFARYKRFIHEFSREVGKKVRLVIRGADTELDKTVIERLNDTIVHIIRNCLDHGIESPEIRLKKGKPAEGTILLAAEYSGPHVLIRVGDDGAGIDTAVVRRLAVERGLLADDEEEVPEERLYSVLFAPGFSTVSRANEVSGRGVGMDVVKQRIEELRGGIQIVNDPGKGLSVVLRIPLTLAIIEGLLIRVADTHYVLPISDVEECLEITPENVSESHGRRIVGLRDLIVPYVWLRELFHVRGGRPEISYMVVARQGDLRVGFVVDEVVGEYQTVIRSLGPIYRNARVFSGSTILPDGRLALIVDIPRLVEVAERESLIFSRLREEREARG